MYPVMHFSENLGITLDEMGPVESRLLPKLGELYHENFFSHVRGSLQ